MPEKDPTGHSAHGGPSRRVYGKSTWALLPRWFTVQYRKSSGELCCVGAERLFPAHSVYVYVQSGSRLGARSSPSREEKLVQGGTQSGVHPRPREA